MFEDVAPALRSLSRTHQVVLIALVQLGLPLGLRLGSTILDLRSRDGLDVPLEVQGAIVLPPRGRAGPATGEAPSASLFLRRLSSALR